MINKINTLRTVANNLTSHLFMEGKTKIKKPSVIIPGALALAGTVVTLETKDNSASLTVQKDNNEIQRADFNYNETPDGYELVSATSSYFYDDKENKEIQQKEYLIEPKHEKSVERSINYINAPMRETTRTYIDNINSSIAQTVGYKSDKTDYDPQESHTYGKKSLQRDIPALLKVLDIIAPNAEFTLKMKDKLKKDNKTSLVAFEASNTENGNEIVRGFMSANGDSVSYRINTKDMIIIGEQSSDKDLSRAYLKPEEVVTEQKNAKEKAAKKEKNKETTKNDSDKKAKISTGKSKKQVTNEVKQEAPKTDSTSGQPVQTTSDEAKHVRSKEYYIHLIFDTALNDKILRTEKTKIYKETLALAYLDGYSKSDLEDIMSGMGNHVFSKYCKKTYIEAGIKLANEGNIQKPVQTLDDKIEELKKIKINTEDEDLNNCVQGMIREITKIKDETVKAALVDKALNILKNSSSTNFESGLLSFVREAAQVNDDLKFHYEIYTEIINERQVQALKLQIEKMINNIPDTTHHKERNGFLTQLYVSQDLKELLQLQKEVQDFLNKQISLSELGEASKQAQPQKLSIEALSKTNKKLVMDLLKCKSPRDMTLTFEEIENLLEDIGFKESNVKGTHHKFIPPMDIFFNGVKQSFITVTAVGSKKQNPGQIDDLISICRQYYGV